MSAPTPTPTTTLFTVGLMGYPFRDRVEAAARWGYPSMSVNAWEAADELHAGGVAALRRMRRIADDHGVALSFLEPVDGWLSMTTQTATNWTSFACGYTGPEPRRIELPVVETIAHEVGARYVTALANPGERRPDDIVAAFVELCDLADTHDWTVALEFSWNSALPTVRDARKVVEQAAHPRGWIMFDTWHFLRRDPQFDELDAALARSIACVQIRDARPDLTGDAVVHALPGEGTLALAGTVERLAAADALGVVGPEVLVPHDPRLSCDEAVGAMTRCFRRVLPTA